MKKIKGGVTAPQGFSAMGLNAGIKKDKKDMAMIYSVVPCTAAGTFTTNVVKAAPVKWDQQVVKSGAKAQAVVVNSGIANACTGAEGFGYCKDTADAAAKALNISADGVLIGSTGVIGKQIPIDKLTAGIKVLAGKKNDTLENGTEAAKAIMTTDTFPKELAVAIEVGGKTVTIGGMAKGSGMIHPNMCTMLAFITTDAVITKDALQKAFVLDDSGFSGDMLSADFLNLENAFRMGGDSLDLSGMINLDQISLDVSGMPQMNLGDMIGSLDLTVKPGGMQKLSESVMEGYQEYVKFHPEADYSNLARDFMDYLMTDEAQKILKDNLQEIIESTGGFKITIDQMQELVQRVMEGYQKYAAEKGYTDPDKFGEYLAEYLQTEEAKEIMNAWQQEIFGDTVINITSDQLKKLTKELASSYPAYAAANGKADPTKMGDYFLNYLATADGKQRLMNGLSEVIDMDQLESQLSATMGSYMAKAMGTYTRAISDVLETQITSAMNQIVTQITGEIGNAMQAAMGNVGAQLQNMLGSSMKIDTDAFAKAFQMNMTEDDLKELMTSMTMSATASYDNNLQKLGYVDFANPSQISIYPTDFESKEKVVKILDSYNSRMEKEGKEEQIITYTDIVGTLMSSVTNIVDIISYVLIAFVAISLVVSSIMIGVITYISVLERKKEIGILRAIGASKRNVSQVFNAETVIIGLCAGLIGIGLSLLLLIPGNMIIHAVADNNKINAFLPVLPAIVLILLSIGLTLLGGIIPSRKAAKSDPVTALRTE